MNDDKYSTCNLGKYDSIILENTLHMNEFKYAYIILIYERIQFFHFQGPKTYLNIQFMLMTVTTCNLKKNAYANLEHPFM